MKLVNEASKTAVKTAAEIHQLSVAFYNKKHTDIAVDCIDFNLLSGKTLTLLGETGCGKSMTALALMRLLPNKAFYGMQSQVLADGVDLLNLPEKWMQTLRGRKLAMIFQEPMTALNPVLTIGTQLAECISTHQSLKSSEIPKALTSLLEAVELTQPKLRLSQYPHELSGGQKQRIVIAMALACKPDILIADEPTTALDVTIQAQILDLLKRLQQKYQMALLLITHDLGVVKAMADYVCLMYAGQIVEYASSEDFLKRALHPYAQQLLASRPSFAKRGKPLQVFSGNVPSLQSMPSGCRFHPRCAYALAKCKQMQPELQTIQNHNIRCHLYPNLSHLPKVLESDEKWTEVAPTNKTILSVQDLEVHFYYKTGNLLPQKSVIKAVDKVSFSLNQGQTLALVGESGCGKTTLARALLGLLPIASGTMQFNGEGATHLHGKKLSNFRKKVQIIFQDPFSSMNPRMTIAEILAEGMQAHGLTSREINKKLPILLDQVHLPLTSIYRYPHQFSGGQRQRICIARALAMGPEILICDEPTSALDISIQAQILNLLKKLQRDTGVSFLFITHNMEVVSYMADAVLVMKAGKIVEEGSCNQILHNAQHTYTKELLASTLKF